jgi:hypothetical protein
MGRGGTEVRIDAPDRVVVISGDTAPTQALIDHSRGCDVLVHEAYSRAAPEHLEGVRDILRSSDFEGHDVEAKRAGRFPDLGHCSSRLPARSSPRVDSPVVLPPGRAKLATKPLLTPSPRRREYDRDYRGRLL